MIRKLAIAAIPVFIKVQPLGSLQAVLGEIVLVIYIFVVSYLKPFGNPHDNLLQVGSMIGESPKQKALPVFYISKNFTCCLQASLCHPLPILIPDHETQAFCLHYENSMQA